MPFGKKALTPQAHTQGVGDEAHVAEMLEFLGRRGSRLMCPLMTRDALGRVVVEDGLFRLQRPGRGFQAERSALEEGFKLSELWRKWISSDCSGRSRATLRFSGPVLHYCCLVASAIG